ncbi:tetratricopeptide repeat protein [Thiomicrolovo sp. ZZH C-3]
MQHFVLWLALLLLAGNVPAALAHPGAHERLAFLDRLIAHEPGNATHYLHRAQAHLEAGHPDHAFEDIDAADRLGAPRQAAMLRAEAYEYRGELLKAREVYDAILKAAPDYRHALLHRAELLEALKQPIAALRDYLSLLERNPEAASGQYRSAAHLMLSQPAYGADAALALLDKRMAVTGPLPQLQEPAIEIELARGKTSAALKRMHSLNPLTRKTPKWNCKMAEILLMEGRPEAAGHYVAYAEQELKRRAPTAQNRALSARVARLKAQTAH